MRKEWFDEIDSHENETGSGTWLYDVSPRAPYRVGHVDVPYNADESEWIEAGRQLVDSGRLDDPLNPPTNIEMYAFIKFRRQDVSAMVEVFARRLLIWLGVAGNVEFKFTSKVESADDDQG